MYSTTCWILNSPALFWILSTTEKISDVSYSRFTYVTLYSAVILVNFIFGLLKAIKNDEKSDSLFDKRQARN